MATVVDFAACELLLHTKFPNLTQKGVLFNAHALPGSHLHQRFASAVAAAPHMRVDVMLHGTHEANIASVLAQGLRRDRARSGGFWLTDCAVTAGQYARGASRLVAFAVLRPVEAAGAASIYVLTLEQEALILPLFILSP